MSESSLPWPWIRLKDLVAEMCLGKMLDKAKNQGSPQPYLGNINVRWFSFDLSELKEMRFEDNEIERFSLRAGDLVVCEGGEPGRASVWNGQTACMMIQKALHRIRFYPEVYDPRFGMYFLFYGTTTNRFAEFYTGTTIKHLTGTALSDVLFPLPPLPEQHRIVEKIEELFSDLDAGVSALERAKANLKRYRASVLKSAVEGRLTEEWRKEHPQTEDGQMLLDRVLRERREKWEKDQLAQFKKKGKEPPRNWQSKYEEPSAPDTSELPELPEGWVWATVEQLSTKVTDGVHKKPTYVADGIPFITVRNLTAGQGISFTDTSFVTEEDHAEFCKRTHPEKGDLLISKDGTLGVVRAIRTDTEFSIFVSVALVKPIDRGMADYWEIAFCSPQVQRQMVGKGSGLQHIHLEDLRQDCIPLPALAEQEQIVAIVEERLSQIDSAEKTIDAELIRSKRLRQSILKQAFEGKLVAQDPQDEAASVLLERIKANKEAEQPKKKAKKAGARGIKTGRAS
jgi:type I restriction enzyme S subunit